MSLKCEPASVPQENRHIGKNFVRFAFCKTDETLLAAKEAFSVSPLSFPTSASLRPEP